MRNGWIRKTLAVALMAGLTGLLGMVSVASAAAVEPGHYGPGDQSGHGVFINCNASDECSVFWFNHLAPDEQVWLMSATNCPRGPDAPCDVDLLRPSAERWNGAGGTLELGDPVGTLELTPMADGTLAADWTVFPLRPDACNTGAGDLLLEECIGPEIWVPIATNPPPRE